MALFGLNPGVYVRNLDHPNWGIGQIQSAIGNRITINFEHNGKVLLHLDQVRLEIINENTL